MSECVEQTTVRQSRQPLDGQRGPRGVAAQSLEALTIARRYGNVGVDADTSHARTTFASGCRKVLDVDSVAEAQHGLAGARSCGDTSADGSGGDRGKQRLVARDRIDLVGIGVRAETTAFEQPGDPARDAQGHANHLAIVRGR